MWHIYLSLCLTLTANVKKVYVLQPVCGGSAAPLLYTHRNTRVVVPCVVMVRCVKENKLN